MQKMNIIIRSTENIRKSAFFSFLFFSYLWRISLDAFHLHDSVFALTETDKHS